MIAASPKSSFFSTLLAPLTGADRLAAEKARLEAFLGAFPGEYCGFHEDGSVAYSDGFFSLLGLENVHRIEDIQAILETGDAAALEGQYLQLEETRKPFNLRVALNGGRKIIRLRGAAGEALDGRDRFNILWAEDMTGEDASLREIRTARESAERELGQMQGGLDHLPIPVWIRDATLDLVWVNQAYAGLVGMSAAEAVGAQAEITLSPKSKGILPKDMAREALTEGKPRTSCCHLVAGGKRKWVEITEMPLPGTDKLFGLIRDLTREEELQAELDRYLAANKTLMEQLRSAIALFGPDHHLEFYNAAFAHLWGLEDPYLNSKPKLGDLLEKLRENRRLPEQADFRKYKQGWIDMFTRLIDPHEDMMYLPDGSALRLLVVPHPMGGIMLTFEDVTSRLELESSYNTLIAVQKETLDNLAAAIVVYGGDGRIQLWNPAFASLWNLNPEDLEGKPHIGVLVERMSGFFEETSWPDTKTRLMNLGLERAEKTGRMPERTDSIHLSYATVPLPDGGVMVSFYDMTDSTRVETALRDKNEALEAAEQLKTDFLANVSYQLRTPLNSIMGFAEILGHEYFGALNERQKEYTTGIHDAGGRLTALIDDILDLASIEAGYLELEKADVDVPALLSGLHDLTTEWARKRKITANLSCPPDLGRIHADERRIKQAILNLIRNAINFTPEHGRIDITGEKIGDSIKITVKDSGIGIAAEDIARIFEPFERLQNAGKQTGAGLGLSLVKNIAELHGGKIQLESVEGTGTEVSLIFPAGQPA